MNHLLQSVVRLLLRYSLRTKLITGLLFITLIPIALLGYFNLLSTQQALTTSANQTLLTAANKTAAEIDSFVQTSLNFISLTAQAPDLEAYLRLSEAERTGTALEERVQNILLSLSRETGQFHINSYALLDQDGLVLLSRNPNEFGQSEAESSYFRQTVRLRRPYVSRIEFPERPGSVHFFFSSPILRDSDNVLLGVLRVRYSVAIFQEFVIGNEESAGEDSFAAVLNQDQLYSANGADVTLLFTGVRAFMPDEVAALLAERRLPNREVEALSVVQPMLVDGLETFREQPVFAADLQVRNQIIPHQVAAVPLDTLPWTVIFAQPRPVFLQPVNQQIQTTVMVTLAVAGGMLLATVILAELVTRPIRRLTITAEQITAGHLDVTLAAPKTIARTKDEINILSMAFYQMLTQLRELLSMQEERVRRRTQTIETGAEISRQIAAILDVDQLLHYVVDRLQREFDLYYVQVYLLNSANDAFVMTAGVGDMGQRLKAAKHQIQIDNTNSLVAQAGREQRTLVVPDVLQAEAWLAHDLLPDTRSEVAIPILMEDTLLGILNLHDRHLDRFDPSEVNLFNAVANQLGIALQNARLYAVAQQEIAERRKAESALQEANQELRELNASKDKFFSIVAHDLKGPFQPLLGNAEFLTQMAGILPPEDIKEMSQAILRSSRRVFDLLESLLQWARLQMGRMPFEPHPINLTVVAQKTVYLLEVAAQAKQITLTSTIDPHITVYADENMLNTIIRNLTTNALKFTPQGGQVTLAANAVEPPIVTNGSQYVAITIADTGVGMSEEDQAKLFRLDVSHTTVGTSKESGTGLGLLMCHEMVTRHGGQIWVQSQLGQGTQVSFTLPSDD